MPEQGTSVAEGLMHLEIVTPERKVYSGDVESVSAPGVMGNFQVLRDHAPFLTEITIGEIRMKEPSGNELQYATNGGFVEISGNRIILLAETAERKDEIDIERARTARSRAEERIERKEPGTDLPRARLALARAINRLRIAEAL